MFWCAPHRQTLNFPGDPSTRSRRPSACHTLAWAILGRGVWCRVILMSLGSQTLLRSGDDLALILHRQVLLSEPRLRLVLDFSRLLSDETGELSLSSAYLSYPFFVGEPMSSSAPRVRPDAVKPIPEGVPDVGQCPRIHVHPVGYDGLAPRVRWRVKHNSPAGGGAGLRCQPDLVRWAKRVQLPASVGVSRRTVLLEGVPVCDVNAISRNSKSPPGGGAGVRRQRDLPRNSLSRGGTGTRRQRDLPVGFEGLAPHARWRVKHKSPPGGGAGVRRQRDLPVPGRHSPIHLVGPEASQPHVHMCEDGFASPQIPDPTDIYATSTVVASEGWQKIECTMLRSEDRLHELNGVSASAGVRRSTRRRNKMTQLSNLVPVVSIASVCLHRLYCSTMLAFFNVADNILRALFVSSPVVLASSPIRHLSLRKAIYCLNDVSLYPREGPTQAASRDSAGLLTPFDLNCSIASGLEVARGCAKHP
ncbi:hypothetical protein BV25DRAFT_1836365 [Artomyces pyxidatus]|uniref:Uncharacterized protein n=1 Tax=Artomyces pyxidatus TaxID=48021 RepID=A0ACB8TBA0_9AGAM|nr:hypothetical protein BV25DRAFT_1836365 [Artomyces pyxidatus]